MTGPLYDEYLRETQQPRSLYDEYLAEQKKKPGIIDRMRARLAQIGTDDEVPDPLTGAVTRRSETPSSSREFSDVRSGSSSTAPAPSRLEELATDMQDVEPGMPRRQKPGIAGDALLRGAGSSIEMLAAAAQTATGGNVGETGRKVGQAVRESAPPKRVPTRHDVHGVGDALTYGLETAIEGGASTLPIMAAGAAGGPIAAGGVAFAFAAGETRMTLEQMGITDEATIRKVTAIVSPAVGLLDTAVPVSVVKNIIRSSVERQVVALGLKATAKVAAKALAKTALEEGATEAAQSVIQNAGTRKMTGQPVDWRQIRDQATEEGIGGALVGGVMGGAESHATIKHAVRPEEVQAALHPATPPEVAQRIAQSANANNLQPERISGAAVQVNGNTYKGTIHADAVRAAIDAGDLPAELLNAGEMDATHLDHGAVDGYVTSKGRFVNRHEAEQIAEAQDQLRPDRVVDETLTGELAPGLDAIDLKSEEVAAPKVGEMRTMDILADPSRFQFKSGKDEKTGAGGALKKVDMYREDLAGILTVWRDPSDGKVYVVNGHHRLDLAKRSGQPSVLVRFITAPNAEAARAQGAIQNIAEGQGTPTDVAKFLRDTRQTLEDLKAQGVPVEGTLAEKGIGLSRLASDLFQKVATGKIDEAIGVGVGNVTADPDMQRTAAAVIQKSGKRLTEKEAADVTRQIVAEGSENVSQETLFGTEQERVPLYVEKAQLAGAIQRRLETDKRLFSYITKGSRADELARAGNVINKEKSAEIAEQSAQLGEVFRQLFTRKGAVSDALTEGARRLVNGEKPAAVAEAIYDGIRLEIQAAFTGGKEARVSGDEGDAGRHAETGGVEGDATEGLEPDPNQDALFDALPWNELVAKQRQRLYDKLARARGKEERNAVIRELRELDKVKNQDPSKGVSADEMARRARQGETKQAVDAIAGETVMPTSTDRAQSDIFADQPQTLQVDMLKQGEEEMPEQGAFLSPSESASAESERIKSAAIRTANGKVYEGAIHAEARWDAEKAGDVDLDMTSIGGGRHFVNEDWEDGFTTTSGRFVSREEAYEIADRSDQLSDNARSGVSEGVYGKNDTDATDIETEESQARNALPEEEDYLAADEDLDEGELKGYDSPFAAATPLVQTIRAKAGIPPLPRAPRALIEISRDLADAAGVPLRQGRFNAAMRQAAGVFFPFAESTRVVRYDQVGTVAHEVGHFVSKRHLKNPANKGAAARGAMTLTKTMLAELRAMGHNLYGSRKPAAGYGEEGIAESFKFYVTDPARLTAEAPEFSAALEKVLATQPTLHKALLQAREDFTAHQQSDATVRADALLSVDESVRNMPTVQELVRQTVDDLQPFRKAVEAIGGTDDVTKHAYVLARLTRGDAGLAEEMNERGVINFQTRKRVTKGIIPVLRSIPKQKMQAFRRYLLAERALELHERNIDVGMTKADAKKLQKLYAGEFGKQAEAIWAHSNALLKYRNDAGLLTDDEYRAIKSRNERRVPLYVVFDEEKDNAKGGGWGKKWGRNSSGVHTIKGSARRKIDPLEGILQDTYQTVSQANRHHVAATLYKLGLETEGAGKVVEEVARPKEMSKVSLERVFHQLLDLGIIDPSKVVVSGDGKFGIEKEDGTVTDIDGQILSQWDFREQQNARDQRDMVIPVVIDGERHWLQIQDPKLYEAVEALGAEQRGQWGWWIGSVARAGARALRAGATLTPEFLGRNPFRDIFTAAAYTRSTNKADTVPGVLFAKGLARYLHVAFTGNDEVYERWRIEGGDNAAQLAIDRKELQKHIEHVTRDWHEIARDVVIHPIDVLRMVSAAMENATRLGEFEAVEKSSLKAGDTPRQASVKGAIASRDVTIDFGRHGVAAKAINQIIAFFNASVQGTDKLIQEHRRRPGTVFARTFVGITIPSLLLYAMQHDDPDYKKLPRWRKSLFWNWVQRDQKGELVRIWSLPKPFELGILYGSLPEAIAEWWIEHDAGGFKEWARATANGFTPNVMPTAIAPIIENYFNKNFFTGRKVVPASAERRTGAYQTNEWTGELAREIGERINYSPAKIENLVRGWWGGVGTNYVLPIANSVVRADRKLQGKEPLKRSNPVEQDVLARVPGVRGFIAHPPTGNTTRQVDEFYEAFEMADGIRQSYLALRKGGRPKDASEYAAKHRKELAGMRTADSPDGPGDLRKAHNRLEDLRQQRTEILRDDKLGDDEKKRRVRILDDRMVKIAERGLAAVK